MRQLDEPDTQIKALAAIGMALEMGWAALEPFIFSVADVQGKEQEQVREIVRKFRDSIIADFIP